MEFKEPNKRTSEQIISDILEKYNLSFNERVFLSNLVKDTKKEAFEELLNGFERWVEGAITVSYNKAVTGSAHAGGMNSAFHEVKEQIAKMKKYYGITEG